MRSLGVAILVLGTFVACSSSGGGAAATNQSCVLTGNCPDGQACAVVDGSDHKECVPIRCGVLSDCTGHLDLLRNEPKTPPDEPTAAQVSKGYETVRARDAKACGALVKEIQAGGHCVDTTNKFGYPASCDAVTKTCSPAFSLAHPQGTCCNGSICTSAGSTDRMFRCKACVTAPTACDVDHPCCDGAYCDVAARTCKPLLDLGGDCTTGSQCHSDTCTSGKCTKYTPPPDPPPQDQKSSAPCESSWCSGCTGTCCSYCAGSCQTRCSGAGDF